MFQKGEETRGDLYRLASSPAVQLCDFALRSIKTELIFETIYFIESLLTGRTETNGIVAMEDQLEASGHRMASEGNAGHGARRLRRFNHQFRNTQALFGRPRPLDDEAA